MTMFWPRSIFVINHHFSMWLEHTRTAGLFIQPEKIADFLYMFFVLWSSLSSSHVLVLLLLSSPFSSLFSQKAEAVLNYLTSTKCRLDFRRYI